MSYPQAHESEKLVLDSLMVQGIEALEKCTRLRADMFSLDSHRRLFRIITKMLEEGETVDYLTVCDVLRKEGSLDAVGGPGYIIELGAGIPRRWDPTGHVNMIVEKWKLRTGMRICERYGAQFAEEGPSDATLSLMQAEVFDAMQELSGQKDARIAVLTLPALEETLDYTKSPMGMSYGHDKLDEFTMGMQPGQVTVVGARSGVGKSSLMVQAAYCNAKQGISTDLYSLEMDDQQVQRRLWAIDSGLPYGRIVRKALNISEQRALKEAAYRVAELPIRIYTDSEMSLGQIAAQARLNARRNEMRLMFLDYVQICNAAGNDERTKAANVSRTLTKLAKSERVHVMLLSQLRKVSGEMYNRPPTILDLRETSQLENDASVVILAHRGWDEEGSRISLDGELLVPKQRNGATGAMQTHFNKDYLTFE